MIGDVLAVGAILLGGVFLLMGATGSYAVLSQLGIALPLGAETATDQGTKTGGPPIVNPTTGQPYSPFIGSIGV